MATCVNSLILRCETEADETAIHAINVAAFEQPQEAELVDRLRETAEPFLSWVAELEGEVVGHILFTAVTIDGAAEPPVAGLAPMAVRPGQQGRGIGSALVERGLEACGEAGFGAVIVLGHSDYYPRFGFRPASAWGLRYEVNVPDEVFMAMELRAGSLGDRSGIVRYHPEFTRL